MASQNEPVGPLLSSSFCEFGVCLGFPDNRLAIPRFPWLKEWTYAGMFFNFTGAIASH